jgi:hypothetical protein
MPRSISHTKYNRRTIRWIKVTLLAAVLIFGLASVASADDVCLGQNYDVGRYPNFIAAGDFNGDGKIDLVTANRDFDNISVLLGDGVGRFGTAKGFGVGSRPEGVAVADFNGDQKADIVTVNSGSSNISILLSVGSGDFAAQTNYPVGVEPHFVAVGDFNGDGKADLAVTSVYSSSIMILAGDGAGHFSTLKNNIHSSPYTLAVEDFNHDGKADLLVGHSGFSHVSTLLGDGAGGFGPSNDIQLGIGPQGVAAGDLNGDGNADLVVTNNIDSHPAQVTVLLGKGTGSFSQPTFYNISSHPTSISIGDFDADGKVDIGVADYYAGTVAILAGDGAGNFRDLQSVNLQGAISLVKGDFNNDAKLDLAVSRDMSSGGKVSILFNSCNAVPSPVPEPTPGPTYSISGRVINAGPPFTFVKLSGTQGGISGLDENGNYKFSGLPAGGTYTVTPASSSNIYQFTYSPPSQTFTNLSADQTADFTQILVAHSISGRVTDSNGVGVAGITIVLNMNPGNTVQTDAGGNYSFTNLAAGQSYRVGPASLDYMFNPSAIDITNLNGNVTANFTALPLYDITGRITDTNGAGVSGVFVSASGPMFRSTTSDSNGNYLINDLPAGGDYVLTLSKANFVFEPPLQNFKNLSGHQTANFTALPSFQINGRITDSGGSGINNVTVTFSGTRAGTITTDFGGNYVLHLPAGGNYTITPSKDNYTFQPVSQTFNKLSDDQSANFIGTPMSVRFSASTYSVSEGAGNLPIIITRTGNASGEAAVNYATSDNSGLNACSSVTGQASSRCDYAISIGTLRFAIGETSKTIFIPIIDDNIADGNETFTLTLSNPTGASLGSNTSATITITDNANTAGNPIDGANFFIREHYIDFLGREPDPVGLAGWQSILNNCPPSGKDANGNFCDRIEVSSAFFRSEEFQTRAYFIYRFYSAVGKIPLYEGFMPDFAKVSGFLSAQELEANKVAFVNEFMARPDYQNLYGGIAGNEAYVTALLNTLGLPNHARKAEWVNALNSGSSRAVVLRSVTEDSQVYQKYYNEAFVIMQYFGYLRRSADISYLQWIQTMNSNGGDYRTMIDGFLNSAEYRNRFQ